MTSVAAAPPVAAGDFFLTDSEDNDTKEPQRKKTSRFGGDTVAAAAATVTASANTPSSDTEMEEEEGDDDKSSSGEMPDAEEEKDKKSQGHSSATGGGAAATAAAGENVTASLSDSSATPPNSPRSSHSSSSSSKIHQRPQKKKKKQTSMSAAAVAPVAEEARAVPSKDRLSRATNQRMHLRRGKKVPILPSPKDRSNSSSSIKGSKRRQNAIEAQGKRKKRRFKANTVILRDMLKQQKIAHTKPSFQKAPLERLIREIADFCQSPNGNRLHFQHDVFEILQESAEAFLIFMFNGIGDIIHTDKRKEALVKDLHLWRRIEGKYYNVGL